MATVQRRDTPAARAALARRRQRAAAVVVRPHSNMAAVGFDGSGPLKVDTSGNDKLRVKEVISSPVRSSNTRPSVAGGGAASPSASNSRSNIPRSKHPPQPPTSLAYSKLKVDTVGPPVVKQGQNRLSPLAQRAVQSMHKASPSNHTIDGTLTTYTGTSASRSFSPVKKAEHNNNCSNYYSNPASKSISSDNAGQTLKRATDITETATRSAYRASPYQTSSSSSAGPLKKGASLSDSGKRLYDGRPGAAAATNKRDTSPYHRNQSTREAHSSPYRNQSPTSKHPPSPKANYLSKEIITKSGGVPIPKSNTTTTTEGRRTFESKSPGRPRSSFEKRLHDYKKEDLVAATKTDANRNEGLLHAQKSKRESSFDPTNAKSASAYTGLPQTHHLENNSSPRRRVEPIGRGAVEDPLSASRRKKAAFEAKKQETVTGNSTSASPLYNNTMEQRGSPEEGPLSARRMKMEAADSQQHQQDDSYKQIFHSRPPGHRFQNLTFHDFLGEAPDPKNSSGRALSSEATGFHFFTGDFFARPKGDPVGSEPGKYSSSLLVSPSFRWRIAINDDTSGRKASIALVLLCALSNEGRGDRLFSTGSLPSMFSSAFEDSSTAGAAGTLSSSSSESCTIGGLKVVVDFGAHDFLALPGDPNHSPGRSFSSLGLGFHFFTGDFFARPKGDPVGSEPGKYSSSLLASPSF
jgi:hypothetical protein